MLVRYLPTFTSALGSTDLYDLRTAAALAAHRRAGLTRLMGQSSRTPCAHKPEDEPWFHDGSSFWRARCRGASSPQFESSISAAGMSHQRAISFSMPAVSGCLSDISAAFHVWPGRRACEVMQEPKPLCAHTFSTPSCPAGASRSPRDLLPLVRRKSGKFRKRTK